MKLTKQEQKEINEFMRDHVDQYRRKRMNVINIGGEGPEHARIKTLKCLELFTAGIPYYTEVVFNLGGRCDILVPLERYAIEVVVTEGEKSITRKRESYPCDIIILSGGHNPQTHDDAGIMDNEQGDKR